MKKFKNDLQKVRPMLDEMFDFEKSIADRKKVDYNQFKKSGQSLYLRSGLVQRWNTLMKYQTYPNMISCLDIN